MKISVRDFRGVADFEAVVKGQLIVAGANASGKSSVCKGVAAAITGDLLPFRGVKKGTADLLVRDGGNEASVTIEGADGSVVAVWPACKLHTKGTPPKGTPIACALVDPIDMSEAETADWLIELLEAIPDTEALTKALVAGGASDVEASDIAASVYSRGWDAAAADTKEGGIKAKGEWERITGSKYGSAKGQTWRPAGWRADMEAVSIEAAKAHADDLAALVETARKNALVGESRRRDAERQMATRQDAHRQLPQDKRDIEAARADLDAAKAARSELGVGVENPLTCPCCGEALMLTIKGLVKLPVKTALASDVDLAERRVSETSRVLAAAEARLARHQAEIAAGDRAQEFVADLPPVPDERELGDLRGRAGDAQREYEMCNRTARAAEAHAKIQKLSECYRLLSPNGLRRATLDKMIGEFAIELEAITARAGWGPVAFTATLDVTYGGRPVSLVSDSEKWRARAAIQIAAAKRDGSEIVILDGADILDPAGRNGLMKGLADMPALIGMTLRESEVSEKMKASGRVVWVTPKRAVAPA